MMLCYDLIVIVRFLIIIFFLSVKFEVVNGEISHPQPSWIYQCLRGGYICGKLKSIDIRVHSNTVKNWSILIFCCAIHWSLFFIFRQQKQFKP